MRPLTALFAIALSFVSIISFADQLEPEVRVQAGNSLGSGTVFFLDTDDNAYVLTNNHVAGKKGNRVGIEFWSAGKLLKTTPGLVVESRIDNGYTDVSVVKIAKADLPGEPNFIPLAEPDHSVSIDTVIFSCGSPGGVWQSRFKGRVFKSDARQMQFYPRPGGGRSGSSIQVDGRIVGLLTWSSGKPGYEEHGTDGRGYSSGFGIAQQMDQIWPVLRGQTSENTDVRPESFQPLVFIAKPIGSTSVYGVVQDEDFKMTPEDQAALLRRRQKSEPGGGLLGGNDGPVVTRPFLYGVGRGVGVILGFIIAAGILVAVCYFVYKRFFGGALLLFVCLVPAAGMAQQSELDSLAEKWSRQAVSSGENWGTYQAAYDGYKRDGGPLVTIVTIPGCPACETLKGQLRDADRFGYFNESHTSIVDAKQNPGLAAQLCGDAERNGYPVLVIQTHVLDADGNKKFLRLTHNGTFPSAEDVTKRIEQMNETPSLMAIPVSELQTLKDFLVGAGVK